MDDIIEFLLIVGIYVGLGFIAYSDGKNTGVKNTTEQWRANMVTIGAASYNITNGEWQLKPEYKNKLNME